MHPQPIVGLGNPAIFVQGSTQNYKEYTSLETLAKILLQQLLFIKSRNYLETGKQTTNYCSSNFCSRQTF